MDLISHNYDDGYINLVEPRILVAETSQKDNLHLGKAMKSGDGEDFMTVMGKRNKIFDHRRCLVNNSKIVASNSSTHNPITMYLQKKKKPTWRANQTHGPCILTWWYD